MKICIVAEGCYPYVVGGVSGWVHSIIESFPNLEFIILAIVADRSISGKFVYTLPKNVTAVYELFLNDLDWSGSLEKKHRGRLGKNEYKALKSLIFGQNVDWGTLFDLFAHNDFSIDKLVMGEDFFNCVYEYYNTRYQQLVFSDFLWTMRSIYLPLFFTMKMKVPKADLYHCVSTGYASALGSMAKHFYGSRLLISEHGIYTREREEEIIKAKWVKDIYKNIWIEQFHRLSSLGYEKADMVTCLFEHAKKLQIELGCPVSKIRVTPNGIDEKSFTNLPGKADDEKDFINIGAVLRVAPIKDVKTMIQAFDYAKKKEPRLKLWIMGSWEEDREYAKECFELVEVLGVKDIVFTGRIDIKDYLGRMDATILTSVSEGQPLTILESFAAHCPVIATDVGNCRGLLMGEDDDFGAAGIVTHIMNVEEISDAIIKMAQNPQMRFNMGEAGYKRLIKKYRIADMVKAYTEIYQDFSNAMGFEWSEKPFNITTYTTELELNKEPFNIST